MYTSDQILHIATSLVLTAKRHLPPLPSIIGIKVEEIGDGTFVDTKIGCVLRGYDIIIKAKSFPQS